MNHTRIITQKTLGSERAQLFDTIRAEAPANKITFPGRPNAEDKEYLRLDISPRTTKLTNTVDTYTFEAVETTTIANFRNLGAIGSLTVVQFNVPRGYRESYTTLDHSMSVVDYTLRITLEQLDSNTSQAHSFAR